MKSFSCVRVFATPWTVAYQAPPSMGFSRQEYWSGVPFPSPGDLPDPGIEPGSPTFQADALTSEPPGKPRGLSIVTLNLRNYDLKVKPISLQKDFSKDFTTLCVCFESLSLPSLFFFGGGRISVNVIQDTFPIRNLGNTIQFNQDAVGLITARGFWPLTRWL